MIGTILGPYRIESRLGAGGMGEVYRARDSKLNRDVAIKVLPTAFANDSERLARFTREAQTLAALNHPNIAQIHGLEESGGVRALVMELVEGDDLSTLIARGPIPLTDALPIARQVAEALEAAHELGIVHRDLKPANIKVRADGTVKVLDFGLAKAMDSAHGTGLTAHDLANSPTLAYMGTQAGIILGTAAYMAPEQAKGKTVDKRADIWAFGVVLYEMLAGKRLFDGETVSDVLAAVLTREPDWKALPATTPSSVRRLLERCLDRDPRKRLRDIGEAALLLADPAAAVATPEPVAKPRATIRERAAWAAIALALATVAVWLAARGPSPGSTPATTLPLHFSLRFDPSEITPPSAVISPDGLRVAFTGRLPGAVRPMIFVRSLHEAAARPLAGTEGVSCCVTFSPDGRWIAFVAVNRWLRKVPTEGGAPTTLVDERRSFRFAQPAWADNGRILLTWFEPDRPGVIYELPESGGRPTPVPGRPEHAAQGAFAPRVLPGSRVLLFTVIVSERPAMAVQSLETGERRVLAQDAGFARAVGRSLIWMDNGRLMSAPFDADRLALAGDPVAISVDGLDTAQAPAVLDVSASGALVFLGASGQANRRTGSDLANVVSFGADAVASAQGLVWIDRQGTKTRVAANERVFEDPRLSRDGGRVAANTASVGGDQGDVWAVDVRRGSMSRLSFGDGEDETAVWSPDGAWVAWASSRAGEGRSIYRRRSDGSGAEERLWASDGRHFHADGWTPDGTGILISLDDPKTGWDVALVTVGPTPVLKPLLADPFNETSPRLSPDGRWIVYSSDESGREEIYAQAFPGLGHRVQVSVDGGSEPVWHPGGHEIVYRATSSRQFVSVSVESKETLVLAAPRQLVSDAGTERGIADHTNFDVAADGRLLAIEEPPPDYRVDMHVILGWAQKAGLLPR